MHFSFRTAHLCPILAYSQLLTTLIHVPAGSSRTSQNLYDPWQNVRMLSLLVRGVWKASSAVRVVSQTVVSYNSLGANKWAVIRNRTVACKTTQVDPLTWMDHYVTKLTTTIKQPTLPLSSGVSVPGGQTSLSCSVEMTLWQLPQPTLILGGTWTWLRQYGEKICLFGLLLLTSLSWSFIFFLVSPPSWCSLPPPRMCILRMPFLPTPQSPEFLMLMKNPALYSTMLPYF